MGTAPLTPAPCPAAPPLRAPSAAAWCRGRHGQLGPIAALPGPVPVPTVIPEWVARGLQCPSLWRCIVIPFSRFPHRAADRLASHCPISSRAPGPPPQTAVAGRRCRVARRCGGCAPSTAQLPPFPQGLPHFRPRGSATRAGRLCNWDIVCGACGRASAPGIGLPGQSATPGSSLTYPRPSLQTPRSA